MLLNLQPMQYMYRQDWQEDREFQNVTTSLCNEFMKAIERAIVMKVT